MSGVGWLECEVELESGSEEEEWWLLGEEGNLDPLLTTQERRERGREL